MIAVPVSLVPGCPMKRSVPAASQVWPGVWPWMMGSAGVAAQAASSTGPATRTSLSIDALLLGYAAHLELAVHNGEGEPPLDQVNRVLAEFVVAPAGQDIEVLAHTRGERFEIVRPGDEARCDSGFLRANLEQQLKKIAD